MNTSTIESTVTAEQVRAAMQQVGFGHYARYAEQAASALNRDGVNSDTVHRFAREQGTWPSQVTVDAFINSLTNSGTAGEGEEIEGEVEGFDRERAAFVLEDFARQQGYRGDLTEVFIEAGLVDAPEPEVEEEPEAEAETDIAATIKAAVSEAVAPLVEFARRHGYRG